MDQNNGYPQNNGGYPPQNGGYPQNNGGYPPQYNPNPAPMPPAQPKPGGCSIAGLVLACLSFVSMLIGIAFFWINLGGIITGLIGMILSIVGFKQDGKNGVAIAGLVISIIALLINVILFAACGLCVLLAADSAGVI